MRPSDKTPQADPLLLGQWLVSMPSDEGSAFSVIHSIPTSVRDCRTVKEIPFSRPGQALFSCE